MKKKCGRCGHQAADDATYCVKCGWKDLVEVVEKDGDSSPPEKKEEGPVGGDVAYSFVRRPGI